MFLIEFRKHVNSFLAGVDKRFGWGFEVEHVFLDTLSVGVPFRTPRVDGV